MFNTSSSKAVSDELVLVSAGSLLGICSDDMSHEASKLLVKCIETRVVVEGERRQGRGMQARNEKQAQVMYNGGKLLGDNSSPLSSLST
eukprot:scaffold4103_cov85-Skeletonema_dohrnii-CCMP3373.AAC.4